MSINAEIDRITITQDNDIFVGNDSGYSNGLYVSILDTTAGSNKTPTNDFWVSPLMWTIPEITSNNTINGYTFGQAMNTPSDISVKNPDSAELPYSAFLGMTNSYLIITPSHADRIATTVGIIGPAALGEPAQKFVHRHVGSSDPKGWDTQLQNEIVFSFSRSRYWRTWASQSDTIDFLTNADIQFGTIQSSINSGMTIRYGRGLLNSYSTGLFNRTGSSNPISVGKGWHLYLGCQVGYDFNKIFTDGNTFRDSRLVSYKHEYIAIAIGLAYAFEDISITYAVNDMNILAQGNNDRALRNLTRYGSLTFAWQL